MTATTAEIGTANNFTTLHFERAVNAPLTALWHAWTAPAARAVWSAPHPSITVEFVESDTRVGGREISLCHAGGRPPIRCECGWLYLAPPQKSVNYEVISHEGKTFSAALVTAEFTGDASTSRFVITVQLSSLEKNMVADYNAGFGGGLDNLVKAAERTMILERVIKAPRQVIWDAWVNPETLPLWWGPNGFSCRTDRIDIRAGGEWVFDMIGPDGTVYPNHHLYQDVCQPERLSYTLLWAENGPKHADAWAQFEVIDEETTRVILGMVFTTAAEYQTAKGFGAIELGLETLGKLERFVKDA